MFRRVNNNKFGVIEYAIDTEEDLDKLPKEDTNNTVYAILRKDGKNLIYLYSKELKDYILINGDLEGINAELENINEQLETKANLNEVIKKGNVTLNECDEEMLSAIEGGEGTNFNLLSIPRDGRVNSNKLDVGLKAYSDSIFPNLIENNTINSFFNIPFTANTIVDGHLKMTYVSNSSMQINIPTGSAQPYLQNIVGNYFYFYIDVICNQDTTAKVVINSWSNYKENIEIKANVKTRLYVSDVLKNINSNFRTYVEIVGSSGCEITILDYKFINLGDNEILYELIKDDINYNGILNICNIALKSKEVEKGKTRFYGKKMTSYGDSLVGQGKWQQTVVDKLGFSTHVNCGKGGYRFAKWDATNTETNYLAHQSQIDTIPIDTDVLMCLFATNDWGNNRPIGDITVNNKLEHTLIGAFNLFLERVYARIPNVEIVILGTLFGYNNDSRYGFINNVTNELGLTSIDYGIAIGEICKQHSLQFIPLGSQCGLNIFNKEVYYTEEVANNTERVYIHINNIGGEKVGNFIADNIK